MSSVLTSRPNFLQRSRNLVERFYPFLEFVGEQSLMAALIGSSDVDLSEGEAETTLLAQEVAASFQSFQSGGKLAAEFLADVLQLIAEDDDYDAQAEIREILEGQGFVLGRESIDAILAAAQLAVDAAGEERSEEESESNAARILAEEYVGSKFGLYVPLPGTAFDIFRPSGGTLVASSNFLRGDPRFEQEVQRALEQDSAYVRARNSVNLQTQVPFISAPRNALARAEARVRRQVARRYGAVRSRSINDLDGFAPLRLNTNLINPQPNDPEIGPNLLAVLINDVDLMPANRDTGITELFMNFIPSIEMSRAVPHLNVFLCARERSDGADVAQITSLAETLGMEDNLTRSPNGPTPGGDIQEDGTPNDLVATGIELFTSPQTLTTATRFRELDELGDRPAAKNPLDPSRPPASFSGLNISVVSAGAGLISHKSAKMTITVHDRGRLSDFAHFIKPELYSDTHLVIEYGWSHPDNDIDQNPFGYLINTLRTTEKYTITGSSFSLNETGEVTIDIDLFARGTEALGLSDISRGEGVEPIIEQIDAVTREINAALSQIRGTGADVSEIFSSQILGSITSTDSSVTGRTDDFNEALASFLTDTASTENNNIKAVRDQLIALYGEDPSNEADTGALTNQLRATITASLERKGRMLNNGVDPFLDLQTIRRLTDGAARRGEFSSDVLAIAPTQYVSLGKLLMIYLGRPLAATKKFKEVQFVFYPFNDKASNVYRSSTANFPINKQSFIDALARETQLSANLPIGRFGAMINREFIANQASEAYGFSSLYQPADADGRREIVESLEGQQTKIAGLKQRLLKQIYGGEAEEAVFNLPSVTLYPEPVYIQRPGRQSDESNEDRSNTEMFDTILRIHVFDQRASAKETALQIYQSALSTRLGAIRRPREQEDTMGHQAAARRLIESAVADGVLDLGTTAGSSDSTLAEDAIPTTYRIAGGAAGVKRFMRKVVPSIRYGTQGSAALAASFQSNTDALMATAHILNAQSGRDGPPGVADGGLPLRISPTTVSMTTIGFPWFNYGQQFFVDFDTGTTADNVYGITSVQHTIAPGDFKTELSLVPVSDAYGSYRALSDDVANALQVLRDAGLDNEEEF